MARSKIKLQLLFADCWPNAGPGRLPLEAGCRDVELADVLESVASLIINFVSECIF